MPRNRLTAQAIADVKAATTASLIRSKGGYRVDLCNGRNCVRMLDKISRAVVFPSQDAAKRTLQRHNEDIQISLKSRLED